MTSVTRRKGFLKKFNIVYNYILETKIWITWSLVSVLCRSKTASAGDVMKHSLEQACDIFLLIQTSEQGFKSKVSHTFLYEGLNRYQSA